MKIVRPVVEGVGGVHQGVRDLARLQHIAGVLAKHGLGAAVSFLPGFRKQRLSTTPERATKALQELGPTFVKLGQILSTRRDILPDEYCDAFEQLQDDVAPLPLSAIAQQLAAELGDDWREQIETFDEEPLATASIAQVHTATLIDGSRAVLKIQRPGIASTIKADLNILQFLAKRLLSEYPEARSFDPIGVLEEFESSITAELDFHKEVENMKKFARNFADADYVKVPEVYAELTTSRILCMEFLAGVKIRNARAAGLDMKRIGDRYLKVAYDMLFDHGFFHGDLHPGNVIIVDDDVIGLIDFGMVGSLSMEMRNQIISIIFALQRGDYRTIARLFYDIAIKDERVDYRAVERDTIEVMERHWAGVSIKEMQMGPYIMDLAARAGRHGARVPQSYTMFFKAIMTSEGLAKSLISEVDPIAAVQPYFQRMLVDRFSSDRLQQELFYNALTLSSLVSRLPISFAQLLDDVDQQRLLLGVKDADADRHLRSRDRLQKRGILAALAITFVLSGTLALLGNTGIVYGIPCFSIILWALAGPFLIGLTLLMFLNPSAPRE